VLARVVRARAVAWSSGPDATRGWRAAASDGMSARHLTGGRPQRVRVRRGRRLRRRRRVDLQRPRLLAYNFGAADAPVRARSSRTASSATTCAAACSAAGATCSRATGTTSS
jgi:hypothetical protein